MRHLALLPRRAARLILPAVVALTVIGGTAAIATSAAASPKPVRPATTFIWHPIPLENGWTSASVSTLVTGTPAWAISNGVVYLRGAIKESIGEDNSTFGQLPKYAWPPSTLYIQSFTAQEVPGIMLVNTDGSLEAYDGNSDTFASLSGISYRAASATMTVHKLGLEHGWASSQSNYGTGDPSYAISDGVVYLSGSMHQNTGTAHVAALLPKAARPAQVLHILTYNFDGDSGYLQIMPTGQIEAFGADAQDYTSLAAISWPAPGAKWHNFALDANWHSGAAKFHTAAPSYAVINGVVYLNGSMYQSPASTGLWTELPAATRTKTDVLEIEVAATGGNAGSIAITNSLGLVSSMPFANAEAFTSIAGVAYPQSA